MEELGLVHGNTVLDLRASFPSLDGAAATTNEHAKLVITMNGRNVWRCAMTHDQFIILPLTRFHLFSNAFLRLRNYHEPAAIEFWESRTSNFALTASAQAAERGTGLEVIADIRSGSSPLPDQLEPVHRRRLLIALMDFEQSATGIAINVEMEIVRYDDDGFLEKACPICMDDFNLGIKLVKTPCSHVFHSNCIGEWLERSLLCPLCRSNMMPNNS